MEQTLAPGTGLLTCALLAKSSANSASRLPGTLWFQWHFGWLIPASHIYQTQERALTVAGQWRIFTAFPNIPVQFSETRARWRNTHRRALAP